VVVSQPRGGRCAPNLLQPASPGFRPGLGAVATWGGSRSRRPLAQRPRGPRTHDFPDSLFRENHGPIHCRAGCSAALGVMSLRELAAAESGPARRWRTHRGHKCFLFPGQARAGSAAATLDSGASWRPSRVSVFCLTLRLGRGQRQSCFAEQAPGAGESNCTVGLMSVPLADFNQAAGGGPGAPNRPFPWVASPYGGLPRRGPHLGQLFPRGKPMSHVVARGPVAYGAPRSKVAHGRRACGASPLHGDVLQMAIMGAAGGPSAPRPARPARPGSRPKGARSVVIENRTPWPDAARRPSGAPTED